MSLDFTMSHRHMKASYVKHLGYLTVICSRIICTYSVIDEMCHDVTLLAYQLQECFAAILLGL